MRRLSERRRVLLLDDEVAVLDALRVALHKRPYDFVAATSASDALEALRRESFDVVVADERMPGMSGSQFLAIARRNYPAVMRIMLTGHASFDAAVRAVNEAEVFRLLVKPCPATDLATAIRLAILVKDLREACILALRAAGANEELDELERLNPGLASAIGHEPAWVPLGAAPEAPADDASAEARLDDAAA